MCLWVCLLVRVCGKKLARRSVEAKGNRCLGAGENLLKHFFFLMGKVRKGRTWVTSVCSYAEFFFPCLPFEPCLTWAVLGAAVGSMIGNLAKTVNWRAFFFLVSSLSRQL